MVGDFPESRSDLQQRRQTLKDRLNQMRKLMGTVQAMDVRGTTPSIVRILRELIQRPDCSLRCHRTGPLHDRSRSLAGRCFPSYKASIAAIRDAGRVRRCGTTRRAHARMLTNLEQWNTGKRRWRRLSILKDRSSAASGRRAEFEIVQWPKPVSRLPGMAMANGSAKQ